MQIAPAECRYLGLFVMVEVYHSARLHCAASHELMMKAGRDGERGQTAAGGGGRRQQRRDGPENKGRESQMRQIFGRERRSAALKLTDLVCLECAAKSAWNKAHSWLRQPLLGCSWGGCCSENGQGTTGTLLQMEVCPIPV